MSEVLTSAQMRAVEQAAIGSGAVTGLELMERAGRGVVQAIDAAPGGAAVVFCGPGNNGGDGYVVARLLAGQGWQVRVFALAPPATPDAQAARVAWAGEVAPLSALDWPDLAARPVVIDALFGTGLVRAIPPGAWGALAMAQDSGCRLVAVDILSGLCADSGRVRSDSGFLDRPADLTVTFHSPKPGHFLAEGGALSGRLVVADIGLAAEGAALLRDCGDQVVSLAHPGGNLAKEAGSKFDHGHALVLAGGVGRGGAARLSARGALRVGAGLVTLACPPAALIENAAQLNAVMLRVVKDAAALQAVLADRRITALCLGPGLGTGAREAALVGAALRSGRACLLDADALTLLAGDADLRGALHGACVLTPHMGEFARLLPHLAARLAAAPADGGPAWSKLDAARAAAAELGAVVLLKGGDTVIAAPGGACVLQAAVGERAAPWLATAGSGDVLAGFIAGLLARGFGPMQAAETGAWLHAEAARRFGPGLIAEDLPEMLPAVFGALHL